MKEIKLLEILESYKNDSLKADEAINKILLLFGEITIFCKCDKPEKYIDYSLNRCLCKKCGNVVKRYEYEK